MGCFLKAKNTIIVCREVLKGMGPNTASLYHIMLQESERYSRMERSKKFGHDWGQISIAEAEVFNLEGDDHILYSVLWKAFDLVFFYEDYFEDKRAMMLVEDVRKEHFWIKDASKKRTRDVHNFIKFGAIFGYSRNKCLVFYFKNIFWMRRNNKKTFPGYEKPSDNDHEDYIYNYLYL